MVRGASLEERTAAKALGAKRNVTTLAYHDTTGSNAATGLGYDPAGNLKGYQQISDGSAATTRYQYAAQNGSYLQSQATTTRGGTTATSNTWRDANGFISNITENNADGSASPKSLQDWLALCPTREQALYQRTTTRKSACQRLPGSWGCPCPASAGLCRDRGL